jgi:hypothetical protein
MADRGPRVIVLLPGLGGSTLFDSNGETIWPGDLFDLFHYPEQKPKLLINDPLTARDIIRSIIGIPIYHSPVSEIVVDLKKAPRPGGKSGQKWPYRTFTELTKIPIQFRGTPPARHGVPIGDIAAFEAGHYRAHFRSKGAKTAAGQCAEFLIPGKPRPACASGGAVQAQRSGPAKKPPGLRRR